MEIKKIAASGVLPVTVLQLKKHLRLTSDDFDDNLIMLLKAAIVAAENFTGQVFIPCTYELSGVFQREIKTGIMPITEIVSIVLDGELISGIDIQVEGSVLYFPPEIIGKHIVVTFLAGFKEIPFDTAAAILLMAAKLFENPVDTVEQLPKASTNLLRPYKRWGR